MNCIDWMSKRSKQCKTPKVIKIPWIASIWLQNDQNVELRRKTFKTTQNLKSDQNTMNCIDLMTKGSKQRKTPKVIKTQWLAWIWWQNDQNNAKLRKRSNYNELHRDIWRQKDRKCWVTSKNIENNAILRKWSNYNELHRFDVKTINNVELRRKTFKTTLNYKLQWLASIWRQNDKKCLVTLQNIENNAKLRKWSKYNELHRFDDKRSKMFSYFAKHWEQLKTTKMIKLRWICIDLKSKR